MRLSGKTAIITGAASGIGAASAEAFAAEGARVLLADQSEAVFDVALRLEKAGGQVMGVVADVGKEDEVEALVSRAAAELGSMDIMFANAGISGNLAPFVDLTEADWTAMFRVNVLGVFFCLKHATRHMLEHDVKGSILMTASVGGLRAGAGPAHYSASKAAVINLVRNAACQLAGTGIRVNAICPGLIQSGMTQPIFDYAEARGTAHKIGQLNPLKRAGQPEEIAKLACMLVSDDASYVNGEAMVADGGLAASLPMVLGKLW